MKNMCYPVLLVTFYELTQYSRIQDKRRYIGNIHLCHNQKSVQKKVLISIRKKSPRSKKI